MASSTSSSPSPPSIIKRLRWWVWLKTIKFLVGTSALVRRLRPSLGKAPSYTKTYPDLPSLVNHVFLPQGHDRTKKSLPLLIDIHGGGFAFGHPWVDDADNAYYAQNHGLCVVSINYRKAPEAPFPIPVQDCALLIKAVLDDESLPVDLSRGVAIAGYSAGGNLALTAPMLDGLHKRFKGVVAFYPAADVGRKTADRIKTSISPPGRKDILIDGAPGFNWAYVPRGQNLKDPLLAPVYAERNMLPEKLFVMGCEYDILCQEAEDFAEHMAEAEKGNKEDLGEGRVGWKIGGLTWENLLGLEHGFNQRLLERDPVLKERWAKATELMRKRVGEWLWEEVYDQ